MVSTEPKIFNLRFIENYFYETLFFIVLNEKAIYKICEFPYMTSSNPGDRNIYRNSYSIFCYSVDISRSKDEGGIDRNVNIIMFSQAFNYRNNRISLVPNKENSAIS